MLFTIYKNDKQAWSLSPTSGRFEGQVVATAEGVDLTSVVATGDKVVGMPKAVWGIQIKEEVYSDLETIRALCLGKPFTSDATQAYHPVEWVVDGIYDVDSGSILRRCKRMLIQGSAIFRRG